MPIYASLNVPFDTNFSIFGFIVLIGIANPIPSADVILTELMPITCPKTIN